LLLAPPGHSRTQAHALIEKTHVHRMLDHEAPHPASTFVLNHKTKFPVPVKQGSGKKKTA
jgi:hypothetical protein